MICLLIILFLRSDALTIVRQQNQIWVLKTTSGYETYPLNSVWDFGFAHSTEIELLLEDITNDDIPEAITRHFHQPGTIGFLVDTLDIFDLSQVPPSKIYFHSQPPFLGQSAFSSLSVEDNENDNRLLKLDIPAAVSYCEARTIQNYQWDGESLVLMNGIYPNLAKLFQIEPIKDLPDCAVYAFKQVVVGAQTGDFGALDQLESLISQWPIREPDTSYRELDQFDNFDTRGKLQFLVGLLYALNGNVDNARQHLGAIVNSSENPESQWIELAEAFLIVYQDEDDLVAGCIASQICDRFFDSEIMTKLNLVDVEDPDSADLNTLEIKPLDMITLEFMIAELADTNEPQAADVLIELMQRWPDYECDEEEEFFLMHYHCKEVYLAQYVTGLAYELTGREDEAEQIYYDLWQSHPNTPYALMAEAKLQEVGD